MNLNISEWKPFIIEKLFTVKYGVNLELSNCDEIINNELNLLAERSQIMEFQLL